MYLITMAALAQLVVLARALGWWRTYRMAPVILLGVYHHHQYEYQYCSGHYT